MEQEEEALRRRGRGSMVYGVYLIGETGLNVFCAASPSTIHGSAARPAGRTPGRCPSSCSRIRSRRRRPARAFSLYRAEDRAAATCAGAVIPIPPRGRRALALQAASDDQHTVSVHCIPKQRPVTCPLRDCCFSSRPGRHQKNVVWVVKVQKRRQEGFLENQNNSLWYT